MTKEQMDKGTSLCSKVGVLDYRLTRLESRKAGLQEIIDGARKLDESDIHNFQVELKFNETYIKFDRHDEFEYDAKPVIIDVLKTMRCGVQSKITETELQIIQILKSLHDLNTEDGV